MSDNGFPAPVEMRAYVLSSVCAVYIQHGREALHQMLLAMREEVGDDSLQLVTEELVVLLTRAMHKDGVF